MVPVLLTRGFPPKMLAFNNNKVAIVTLRPWKQLLKNGKILFCRMIDRICIPFLLFGVTFSPAAIVHEGRTVQ